MGRRINSSPSEVHCKASRSRASSAWSAACSDSTSRCCDSLAASRCCTLASWSRSASASAVSWARSPSAAASSVCKGVALARWRQFARAHLRGRQPGTHHGAFTMSGSRSELGEWLEDHLRRRTARHA
eukprot:scaffold222624_cov32-Tisochrysis_lutea.AAC.3